MFSLIKNESRRFEDDKIPSYFPTINDADWRCGGVIPMTRRAASGKPKSLGSGGSMVAKLKLKGIDGRAPPGVEPAAYFDSTRETAHGPDTDRIDR